MFNCQKCGKISLPGEEANKATISRRNRIYWNVVIFDPIFKRKKYMQFKEKNLQIFEDFKKDGFKVTKDFITKGWEIKKEITVCNNCK